jgi:multidrug resistance efflux pump
MFRHGSAKALTADVARSATEVQITTPATTTAPKTTDAQNWHEDTSAELRALDVTARVAHLRATFEGRGDRPEKSAKSAKRTVRRAWLRLYARCVRTFQQPLSPATKTWPRLRQHIDGAFVRRSIKSVAALAVAVGVGWGPMQRLMQTTSVEAVVNARLITLRAPIDGEILATPSSLTIGAALAPGPLLMKISNRRADRTRLDDLRREIGRLEDERSMLETKLASTRTLHAEFVAQTEQFQQGRVQQLEARASEIRSEQAAARLRRAETAAILQRATALEAKGASTRALLDKAQRDDEIAAQGIAAAEERLKGVETELAAAKSGFFLGDSYNDRPRSSQRADELQQQMSELSAELRFRDVRLAHLKQELEEERARYANLAEATITAPSNGSVWEVLTAPGEDVRRGQELVRVLDCSSSLVTATVAESVYNRLRIGQPARFRFREGGRELEGHVVHLTGVAAAPANFAIAPSALIKEAYRVTVAIPELTQSPTCSFGRTGRVTFGAAPEDVPATTASLPVR